MRINLKDEIDESKKNRKNKKISDPLAMLK